MIDVAGSTHRSYVFPADRPAAFAYYGDFRNVISNLPLISMVKPFGNERYRLVYRSMELGLYRVRIYCDLEARFDEKKHILHVAPLTGHPPVKSRVTINSLTAQGMYTSESAFRAAGDHTRVDYHLVLKARLPRPLGLKLIPDGILERIAHNITMWRIHEIADGFIERSIREFERGKRRRRKRSTD
jgi:hypothetical protein